MKNVLKNIVKLTILPFLLLWRAVKWPFSLFEKKEEPNVIDQIAARTPEGKPYLLEEETSQCRSGGSISYWDEEKYAQYKEANKGTISVKSWSYDPGSIRCGFVGGMRKVMNRWRWRTGMYTSEEVEDKSKRGGKSSV